MDKTCCCLEKRLRRVELERFAVAVAVFDADGGLVAVNRRALEGSTLAVAGLLDGNEGEVSEFFLALRERQAASATVWRTSGERVDHYSLVGVEVDGYLITAIADGVDQANVRAGLEELRTRLLTSGDDMPG